MRRVFSLIRNKVLFVPKSLLVLSAIAFTALIIASSYAGFLFRLLKSARYPVRKKISVSYRSFEPTLRRQVRPSAMLGSLRPLGRYFTPEAYRFTHFPIKSGILLSLASVTFVHLHSTYSSKDLSGLINTVSAITAKTKLQTAKILAPSNLQQLPVADAEQTTGVTSALTQVQVINETDNRVLITDETTAGINQDAVPSGAAEPYPKELPSKNIVIAKIDKTVTPEVINVKTMPVRIKPDIELKHRPSVKKDLWPDITRGSLYKKELSLTFDGGSNTNEAMLILDTLRERGIRTTIFLTGQFMIKNPMFVKIMVEDGHEIGNHMYSHSHLTDYGKSFRHTTLKGVTKQFVQKELLTTANIFEKLTGQEMSPLWRAPFGEINEDIKMWAYEAGYLHIGWTTDRRRKESLDTLDWVSDKSSKLYMTSQEIKQRILTFGKDTQAGLNGGIILMHLGTQRKTERPAERLGEIIDNLTERGYKFVKISSMVVKKDDRKVKLLIAGKGELAMR